MASDRVEKKSIDYFKGLRVLALTAFSCTLILLITIWIESLIPGSASYRQTLVVESGIKTTFQISETDVSIPVGIRLKVQGPTRPHTGDTAKVSVAFSPESAAKKELTFSSSDENVVTVDKDGVITFVGSYADEAYITAVSKANPDATATVKVTHFGLNPNTAENLAVVFPDTVSAGSATDFSITTDGTPLYLSGLDVKADNGKIKFNTYKNVAYAIETGVTTITATFGENVVSKTVTVVDGELTVPTALTTDKPSYELVLNTRQKMIIGSYPDNSLSYYSASSDNSAVAYLVGNTICTRGVGSCNIILTSLFDSEVKLSVPITVTPVLPTSLAIAGDDRVLKDYATQFTAFMSPEPTDDSVVWSIVSGKGQIDESGYLYPAKLGKITIRATSVADPTLYCEKTVTVSIFDTFYMFVRKIIGHFSLFAILGFGLSFTFFMLLKPRWLSPILTVVSGFTAAGVSEMFQLPAFTTGRYSTWTDVWTDTLGVLCGMAIAAIVITLTCHIWKRVNREEFDKVRTNFSDLTFKSAFKKRKTKS